MTDGARWGPFNPIDPTLRGSLTYWYGDTGCCVLDCIAESVVMSGNSQTPEATFLCRAHLDTVGEGWLVTESRKRVRW